MWLGMFTQRKQRYTDIVRWYGTVLLGLCLSLPAAAKQPLFIHEMVTMANYLPEGAAEGVDLAAQLAMTWDRYSIISVRNHKGESTTVHNCNELFAADKQQMYVLKRPDAEVYRYIAVLCYAVSQVASAKAADTSYLDGIMLDKDFPAQAPAEMSFYTMLTGKTPEGAHTWSNADEIVKFAPVNDYETKYFDNLDGMMTMHLLSKGDFNNDGIADIFIRGHYYITSTGHGTTGLFLLTKTSPSAPLQLLAMYG